MHVTQKEVSFGSNLVFFFSCIACNPLKESGLKVFNVPIYILKHYFVYSFGTRLKKGTMRTRLKTGENSITDQIGFCIHFKTSESTAHRLDV